jgi:hypothetical protein
LPQSNSDGRKVVTTPHNGEIRKEATSPSVNRSRSYESPSMQQSPTGRRSTTGDIQRNPAAVKRYETPDRRPVTPPANREIRKAAPAPNVSRTRSYESPAIQRSPAQQRNTPANVQRSNSEVKRYEAPSRSNVQSSREMRPQPSRSSRVESSRPSGGANMEKRSSNPGSTRTIDTKRGRQ